MKISTISGSAISFGPPYRVWPFTTKRKAIISISKGRPYQGGNCELWRLSDSLALERIADMGQSDERRSTTGQPFITSSGSILIPVWDVNYYTEGATYFCILRMGKEDFELELVYEDEEGTYSNHFFQDSTNANIYLGVGVRGGGRNGKIGFCPNSGYVLESWDDGKSFQRVCEYHEPCCLYQGAKVNNRIIFSTRNQNSVIEVCSGREIQIGETTRCIQRIDELGTTVLSSDSSLYFANTTESWRRVELPMRNYVLRYPTYYRGHILVSAVGPRSLILAYDMQSWYILADLTNLTISTFARIAIYKDWLIAGSEFDGKLYRSSVSCLLNRKRRISPLSRLEDKIITVAYKARRVLFRNLYTDDL